MITASGEEKKFHPAEVCSTIRVTMTKTAKAYLGTKVRDAVVTVPAYFNDSQRKTTTDAGTISGMHGLRRINKPFRINKPTAAALASMCRCLPLRMASLRRRPPLAISTQAGRIYFDNRIVDFSLQDLNRKNCSNDLVGNSHAIRHLRTRCERAERTLSSYT